MIHDASEIYRMGQEGTLVVTEAVAIKKGLV